MLHSPAACQSPTLCVAAGKSGGHLIPALQLAHNWHIKNPQGSILLCTYGTKLDEKIYNQYPFVNTIQSFSFTTFIAYKIWRYPTIIYQTIKACVTTLKLLSKTKTEKVITTGGFVALPVCIAARILNIPIEVYELNVYPGKAVKALALLNAKIFVAFNKTRTFLPKSILTSYPIRFSENDFYSFDEARKKLNTIISSPLPLTLDRKTLFIVGGSQGSQYLNALVLKFLTTHPELHDRIQIIHQTGNNAQTYTDIYSQLSIPHLVFDFHSAIAECYQAADLVLCRAGAGTLFELKFFNRPAIIIPLFTSSTSHQEANALAMTKENPALFETLTQAEIEADSKNFFSILTRSLSK